MNAHCGGCCACARAYGMTGDLMAEDPLCTHIPGKFAGSSLLAIGGRASVAGAQGTPARDRRRAQPDPLADADPEILRLG